ncbi:putative bifunctional diguanylate cyclase/phosphodiesterase [Thiorhodovibrio frisius]|uniref:cyclic-guanylate-specific phosphodiesterase n=1 Tax=Thiorhodovibrio frisius TaxID=631362 RepID=H8Z1F9_9GAMM|nr:bifunctional diguanylate cyclase/phosphodiesterase [Thiorhodovibrio frisius]EIC22508.1 PAS domain S-box/diguanylate cyclase (GGDEF) domain-containing protein [Thiorhodovibrio frisius]WPL24808.1 Bacteriophytochrome cph2 [Thiorhodovibrio frisius]
MVESLAVPAGDADALLSWFKQQLTAALAPDDFWLALSGSDAWPAQQPPVWVASAREQQLLWQWRVAPGSELILALAKSPSPASAALLAPLLALLADALSRVGAAEQPCCQALSQHRRMLDAINNSVIGMDLDGYIRSWNRGAEQMFGYPKEKALGRHVLFLYADADEEDSLLAEAGDSGNSREMLVRRKRRDGSIFWASIYLSLLVDEAGEPEGLVGYLIDATERINAEEKLRLQSAIFEYSEEAIMVTNANGRIVSVNRAFARLFGRSADELVGREHDFIYCRRYDADFWHTLRNQAGREDHWFGEIRCSRNGENIFPCWLSFSAVRNMEGKLTHFIALLMDVSERQEDKEKIYQLANFDGLTGLPNRSMLRILLTQALEEAKRMSTYGALMLVDIDRFKRINDGLGVSAGDELLVQIAGRIRTALRAEDVVARCGPDEFVIALFDIAQREHASIVADKLLRVLQEPFILAHSEQSQETLSITASIGVAVFPEDGKDSDSLLRHAGIAMRRLRQMPDSEHGYLFFAADMNQRARERHHLEEDLREALHRGELLLYFQPQFELASGKMQAAEVLLRWQHHEHGMVSPAKFIPVAEETGLIHEIGDWVLETACATLHAWLERGIPPLRLAVNLSARQLRPKLISRVLELVGQYQLPVHLLELEITESVLIQDDAKALALLESLRAAGFAIALDDFGTGYSALSYLRRLPIDTLKIDRSFVADLPGCEQEAAMVLSILRLAQTHGLSVVAEGVETQAQLDFLRQHGCPAVQGFFLARPMPLQDLEELLLR